MSLPQEPGATISAAPAPGAPAPGEQAHALELQRLRAELERLERALAHARAQQEILRRDLGAAEARTDEALALVAEVREPIQQFGAAGLGVARRLSVAAGRYPRTARSVKAVLRRGSAWQRRGG